MQFKVLVFLFNLRLFFKFTRNMQRMDKGNCSCCKYQKQKEQPLRHYHLKVGVVGVVHVHMEFQRNDKRQLNRR